MIRSFEQSDMTRVLAIWLEASVKAHDFVDASFWLSQVESMRDVYIPASEAYVFEVNTAVVGFYALYQNNLAAIFIAPEFQGQGIGKQLIAHAKQQRTEMTLSVYKDCTSW
jgi:putative acetyltransferase